MYKAEKGGRVRLRRFGGGGRVRAPAPVPRLWTGPARVLPVHAQEEPARLQHPGDLGQRAVREGATGNVVQREAGSGGEPAVGQRQRRRVRGQHLDAAGSASPAGSVAATSSASRRGSRQLSGGPRTSNRATSPRPACAPGSTTAGSTPFRGGHGAPREPGALAFVAAFVFAAWVVGGEVPDTVLEGSPATCSTSSSASPTCSRLRRTMGRSTGLYRRRCGWWAEGSRSSRG
jgi:hypothetical protein